MSEARDFPGANLSAFLVYSTGMKETEAEADLLRLVFQTKGLTHYDRENGASFSFVEQKREGGGVILLFMKHLIESVYRMNQRRKFKPFMVLGYEDINSTTSRKTGFSVLLNYRFLQDLHAEPGSVEVPR